MLKAPLNLKKARILISNDDGIHAPGLKVLEKVARALCDDVWVVAPESDNSGASHSFTVRRPLSVHRLGPQRFAVAGTPTDCALVAINHLMTDRKPDLVLSGVNRGANQGEDVIYSGTVAVAMEAAMMNIPAIAMSQVRHGNNIPWQTAETFGETVVRRLTSVDWPAGVLMNVNFPCVAPDQVKGIDVGGQGRRVSDLQVVAGKDPFDRDVLWIGDFPDDETEGEDTDLAITAADKIAVTPLHFDLTHRVTAKRLEAVMGPLKVKAPAKAKTPAKAKSPRRKTR
ncbi:5'/3'-nucleotidase SurE [Dongia soli]|uniref:5'-nucleotidase SurE n=1 Tax=Dongia soli TaxID=600628 RepID=A0ABU5EFC0_9PROT|nr:5'/3'-nucleotidase SurE [Dongia soli]MDY0885104.1 5'/3'-nucleotidase SurE [Dongia soli]